MTDLNILLNLAKNEVIKHLQYFYGDKDIIIETSMMKLLERIVGVTTLRNHGVNKIYKLENDLLSNSSQIVYFLPPIISKVKLIIEHIKKDKQLSITRNYVILYYPSCTFVTDYLMEQECLISDNIIIENLNLHFIPIENNIMSYEQPIYFKELYIENSTYPLEHVNKSLIIFMKLYGIIPLIYSIGTHANELGEMLKFNVIADNFGSNTSVPTIGRLVIFDRNIDMITPSLSQITYEGMLSDEFNINSGYLSINDADLLKKLPPNSHKILLTNKNLIFNQIRDMQLTNVFQYLKDELTILHQLQSKSSKISNISDMKQFVSHDLKILQAKKSCILTHISCGEKLMQQKNKDNFSDRLFYEYEIIKGRSTKSIQNYIENQIIMQPPLDRCLCLIILWCICSNPSSKNIQTIKNLFYHSYGYNYLDIFGVLEKFGIINNNNSNNFERLSREFKLIPLDPKQCKYPLDMGSIYNGRYRPLSCRIIESILAPNIMESSKNTIINSGYFNQFQFIPFKNINNEAQNTVLILMLGGINHSEISCIKTIGINLGLKIIIATTCIVNGMDLMEMFHYNSGSSGTAINTNTI